MAIDITSILTEEHGKRLEEIVNGRGIPDLAYLRSLRVASVPVVERIAERIEEDLGLVFEWNSKSNQAFIEKAKRPAVLGRYPWYSIAHLRDFLRFRTHLKSPDDFEAVLEVFLSLRSQGYIEIVKIDSGKLLRPGAFGWRMLATDLRITTSGMLVEHYMTFSELISINQEWLHAVYERWRNRETDDMTIGETPSAFTEMRALAPTHTEKCFLRVF